MIAILTDSPREASLLAALCDQRSWPCQSFASVARFTRLAERISPRVVVVRHHLTDGYSDDVMAWLKNSGRLPLTHVIVLVPANCSIRQEARQIALGADCVQRDPLRMPVLLEYLARYRTEADPVEQMALPQAAHPFAGVTVLPHEHRVTRAGKTLQVAPQVIALLRLLHDSAGKVAPYPVLYSELFNRRFNGDTSNCRVLLGKAAASFRLLGVNLRDYVRVIPKSGYLYGPELRLPRGRRPVRLPPKGR